MCDGGQGAEEANICEPREWPPDLSVFCLSMLIVNFFINFNKKCRKNHDYFRKIALRGGGEGAASVSENLLLADPTSSSPSFRLLHVELQWRLRRFDTFGDCTHNVVEDFRFQSGVVDADFFRYYFALGAPPPRHYLLFLFILANV